MQISAWVLTDGKAGDEVQCLGVAERLGLRPTIRHVRPRPAVAWAMPYGPIDPKDAPHRKDSPIAPPFPDLAIASGRRAVAYLRAVKRASGGHSFTVFLKDPRIGAGAADLIWVPEHDRLRAKNVLVTLTSPHRLSPDRLAAARVAPPAALAALPAPRVAVLLGGTSKDFSFTDADCTRFIENLWTLAGDGASLMVTSSRRTPPALAEAVARLVRETQGFYWDGAGENPYLPMLAIADAVLVTADSVNMMGEAAATHAPVMLFQPTGGSRKIAQFITGLTRQGVVQPFTGRLAVGRRQPLDATTTVALAIADALLAHRARLGLTLPFTKALP